MADVNGFREHAVIDEDVTDQQLQGYLTAAMGYLKGAEVSPPTEAEAQACPLEAALYDLAVYQLATHYKERRGMVGEDPAVDVCGVQGIIHQLRGRFGSTRDGEG